MTPRWIPKSHTIVRWCQLLAAVMGRGGYSPSPRPGGGFRGLFLDRVEKLHLAVTVERVEHHARRRESHPSPPRFSSSSHGRSTHTDSPAGVIMRSDDGRLLDVDQSRVARCTEEQCTVGDDAGRDDVLAVADVVESTQVVVESVFGDTLVQQTVRKPLPEKSVIGSSSR